MAVSAAAAIPYVIGGVASAVVSNVLSDGPSAAPEAPAPVGPPAAMPLPDDQAVIAARRKSIAAQSANQGRAATILSSPDSQKLGG